MKKLGLVLIIFVALSIIPIQAKSDDPIGFEVNGDVVTIWNPDTTYYFNKTTGVQWVENPDQYWTRNIFSVGYYSGGEWNKIYSADDLGSFNRNIESDFETYVNATLWRDFTYNEYDLRLGIQYHLALDDTDLSVTIYAKNLGDEVYPVPLGFAWTVTDIDIPNPHNNDRIYINQTYYDLDGVYDVTFSNMKHDENGTIEYDSNYRISDYTEFLTLKWDESITYSVRLQGTGVQSEAKVTWMVNAGIFQPGQEKSTTLYWADAEGDFIGVWNLDVLNGAPRGLTTNNTHIFVADTTDQAVYVYDMAGVHLTNWTLTGLNNNPYGITNNGTHLFVVDTTDQAVYVYDIDGVSITNWALNGANTFPRGMGNNGTHIFVADDDDNDIYVYDIDGNFVTNWGLNVLNFNAAGVTSNTTNIWVADFVDDDVYKYNMTGGFLDVWALKAPENADARGMGNNGTVIFVVDSNDLAVYRYELLVLPTTPVNVALDSTNIFSRNFYGWINATVKDLNGVNNLNTVTIQVTTTGDAENLTLRWYQGNNTFNEVSDPSNIVTLGISVRENLNATTDLIAFNFSMTGGTSGLCDVRLTTFDDGGLNDTDLFNNEFEFSYFNWVEEVYFFINSAFSQFGIVDYMNQITVQITALSVYFSSSLTRIVELFVQQFTVIEEVYNFFLLWVGNMFGIVLDFSRFYQSIIDGTNPLIQPFVDLGNMWDLIGYDLWVDAAPMFIFIIWLSSVGKRGKQVVGGEIQVFLNDINTSINLISYFTGIFIYIIETIISRVYGLFDAVIPGILTG